MHASLLRTQRNHISSYRVYLDQHTTKMARSLLLNRALAALALTIMISCVSVAQAQDGWTDGRGTFYDDNGQGSCQYGTNIPTYYAAWPDVQAGFDGSCGRCFEVACVPKMVTDRYGQALDRTNVCYDTTRTVVVKIVDSCPCYHMNYASNQRWCCGDQQHVDLGRAAFAQLAPEEQGVIGLRWREVSCDTQGNPGTSPAGTTDTPQQPQQQQPQDAGNSNDSQGWWDGATKSWKNAPGMSWDNLLQKWTKQGSADNSQQQPQEQQPSDSGSSNSQGWWDDASKSWKNLPGMVWSNLQQKWVNQGSDSNQGSGGGMQGGSWAPGQLLGQVARNFGGWGH